MSYITKVKTNSGLRAFKRSDIPEEYHYRRRFWNQQKQDFLSIYDRGKVKCYLKVLNVWTSAQTRLQYWWSQKKELWSWLQGKSPVHGYIDLCLCLFLIVLTPFCSWRVIFTEILIIVLSNFWDGHDGWPTSKTTLIIVVLSLILEQLSVTSVDDHLMFQGLKCNVQPFTDRPQATATMLRGEFLFKSLSKTFRSVFC